MDMTEEKIDFREMLENEVGEEKPEISLEEEPVGQKEEEDDLYVYRGLALNQQELFTLSCRENIKLVLVAGPVGSGKTTLETMLYYVFLEGRNRKVNFCGSYTMLGFWERAKKIMCSSGEIEPMMPRTSREGKDWFLHLRVQDETGERKNLIFADISGEVFAEPERLKDYEELFRNMENVIIVVDGEKVSDITRQNSAYTDTILLLRQLLSKNIIVNSTKLQIVCTKLDKIEESENREEIEKFLDARKNTLLDKYGDKVDSINFLTVSALTIEKGSESEKIEDILRICMKENNAENEKFFIEAADHKRKPIRQFERFGRREQGNA